MRRSLVLALYGEGKVDRQFLPIIIQRVAQDILLKSEAIDVVCRQVLPLIPVREVEAWMLADPDAVLKVLNVRGTAKDFHLSRQAASVENIADPKAALQTLFARVKAETGREIHGSEIYELLAYEINLERLGQVPAFKEFVQELKKVLIALKLIMKRQ